MSPRLFVRGSCLSARVGYPQKRHALRRRTCLAAAISPRKQKSLSAVLMSAWCPPVDTPALCPPTAESPVRVPGCRHEELERDRALSDDEIRWLWRACEVVKLLAL